jgi:hypothetical protein
VSGLDRLATILRVIATLLRGFFSSLFREYVESLVYNTLITGVVKTVQNPDHNRWRAGASGTGWAATAIRDGIENWTGHQHHSWADVASDRGDRRHAEPGRGRRGRWAERRARSAR